MKFHFYKMLSNMGVYSVIIWHFIVVTLLAYITVNVSNYTVRGMHITSNGINSINILFGKSLSTFTAIMHSISAAM